MSNAKPGQNPRSQKSPRTLADRNREREDSSLREEMDSTETTVNEMKHPGLRSAWRELGDTPPNFDLEQRQIHDWSEASDGVFEETISHEMRLSDIEELIASCKDTAIEHERRAERARQLKQRLLERIGKSAEEDKPKITLASSKKTRRVPLVKQMPESDVESEDGIGLTPEIVLHHVADKPVEEMSEADIEEFFEEDASSAPELVITQPLYTRRDGESREDYNARVERGRAATAMLNGGLK